MKIEDLNLITEDKLALERIVTTFRDRIEENCVKLYDFLNIKKCEGTVEMLKDGIGSHELIIPNYRSEEERLRNSVGIYIYIFDKLRRGWKVGVKEGDKVRSVDISEYFAAVKKD